MNSAVASAARPLRILLLEDNPRDVKLSTLCLRRSKVNFELDAAASAEEFERLLRQQSYDVILADFRVPGWNGLEAFRLARGLRKEVPFILVTGTLGDEVAIECIKAGIDDYILKDRIERLPLAINSALAKHTAKLERASAEARFQRLIENSADGISVTDESEAIVYISPAIEKILGYRPEEVVGRTRFDFVHPEDRESIRNIPGASYHTSVRARFKHKQGTWRILEVTRTNLLADPDVRGIISNFRDVTGPVLAEEEVRRSEERFRKTFRSSPAAITISTLKEGRYLDANYAFFRLVGREEADVIGRTSREIGFWAAEDDREQMLRQLREVRHATLANVRVKTSSGEIREATIDAQLIELDSEPCVLAISQDITEIKKMEAQLRQSQKMEGIGQLAGGVAHDFNNILMAISGYCELLADKLGPSSPLRKFTDGIAVAADRAAAMTRQMLAFSRQQILSPKVLDLNRELNDLSKMLTRLIEADKKLNFVNAPDLGLINADAGQISQVILNLVVNARDAIPKSGQITIETSNVVIDSSYCKTHQAITAGDYVLLSVSDTGAGMPPEVQARIFEPFFTTKEVGRGTGLGLSTVYGIVKQSGGFIWVYSEVGKGTTFKVYLPRVYRKPAEEIPSVQELELQTLTILVVEDEVETREAIAEYLNSKGHKVFQAANGLEALGLFGTSISSIDVLLTDVIMPGMSGKEIAHAMQQGNGGLKVLYMSGYTDRAIVQHGVLEEGANFIQKPYSFSALEMKLRSLVNQDPLPESRSIKDH